MISILALALNFSSSSRRANNNLIVDNFQRSDLIVDNFQRVKIWGLDLILALISSTKERGIGIPPKTSFLKKLGNCHSPLTSAVMSSGTLVNPPRIPAG
ncbi:hypothetical protein PS2_044764 [Malus domestica]